MFYSLDFSKFHMTLYPRIIGVIYEFIYTFH